MDGEYEAPNDISAHELLQYDGDFRMFYILDGLYRERGLNARGNRRCCEGSLGAVRWVWCLGRCWGYGYDDSEVWWRDVSQMNVVFMAPPQML
ncbi:hypothetical protein AA106556_1682 [Neokomagataea tanensis NBRC 106556]|uniref:Transposase n=1 Tax=Neokomagataea tanensis NBRC 106556 TaxID=1223519 RepID=A0ABQ0QKL2_9PROT|nr:hypothetical protein AA106556_1682 [Neokomagataea tanensis NBRC 106556]